MIIIRWSVWNCTPEAIFMLSHSIGTFRYFFQDTARYIVFTDRQPFVIQHLKVPAEVYQYDTHKDPQYLDPAVTWRKWAPCCRLDLHAIELRVDSDMFLLSDPIEIKEFCASQQYRFLVTLENFKQRWPYGNFGPSLQDNFTPINAGLIGQQQGFSLCDDLCAAYRYWKRTFVPEAVKYHDEQGAVAAILQPYIATNVVYLLPPERYQIVSPLNDRPVSSLDGLVLLHATYYEHPAFYQFIDQISSFSGVA